MNAGVLTEVITIQKNNVMTDDYGANKVEWADYITTKAQVTYNSGNRVSENNEIIFTNVVGFTIRIYHKIDAKMHIIWNDNKYRILSIEADKHKQKLIINTELINE